MEELTKVEGDERERKVVTFFHNMHGFDRNFILEKLYDQGRAMEKTLTQGAKIMSFETGNLVFKDSMNFFNMGLDKFPATFNPQELHKGYFPHAFNRVENHQYPPADQYCPDEMPEKGIDLLVTGL